LGMRRRLLMAALVVLAPAPASAEWQIKPFFGGSFGGATTFVDYDDAAGSPTRAFGVSGQWLGDVFGVEADFGFAPRFFQSRRTSGANVLPCETDTLCVLRSGVTTLMGNVVIAMPRRLTTYTLRPYFVAGGGLMHANSELAFGVQVVSSTLPAMDVGGGLAGFLSKRVGLGWDVRYIRSIGTGQERGQSFGPEQLSFWRANMAVAIRY
jgi:hypothetical protein